MKRILDKYTAWDYIYWFLALLPFAISLLYYKRLPDMVPTHWGADNQVSGYSSRNIACFGIPAFMFAIEVLINVFYRIDPKRENISRSRELKQVSRWFVVALGILVQTIIVLAGTGVTIDVGTVVSIPLAVFILIMGNYLPKCRQNYTMGIRLPWTLADEDN